MLAWLGTHLLPFQIILFSFNFNFYSYFQEEQQQQLNSDDQGHQKVLQQQHLWPQPQTQPHKVMQ